MKEILIKIDELLQLSNLKVDYRKGWNAINKKMEAQDTLMDEIKAMSKANNTLLGRIIRFPMADSYAYYIVTNLLKKNVEVSHVMYCDNWIDDRLGKRGYLPFDYVKSHVEGMDRIETIFPPRKQLVS